VIHGAPPIRDEFTHVRYSALTCHPSEPSDLKFVVRPSLFAKPRSTKVLVAISISENDLNSPAKQAAFARTLRSAIQSVRCETWANHVSGKGIWKNIVIGIITDGMVEVSSLSVLEEMGIYWNDPDYRKSSVNHKDVRAHLYEVCRSIPKEL
jgi:chitin synthase